MDENNPSYTKYICGDDGVLDYWLSLGAAGYRLDVADELPDEFLDNLRACVKKFDEEKIVIGEVWKTLPTRRRMVSSGGICWATSWTA